MVSSKCVEDLVGLLNKANSLFKAYIHSFLVMYLIYDNVCYFHFIIHSCHVVTFTHTKVHLLNSLPCLISRICRPLANIRLAWSLCERNITSCLKYMISNNNGHMDTYLSQHIITHLAS